MPFGVKQRKPSPGAYPRPHVNPPGRPTDTRSMLSRRTIILGAFCMAVAKPALAADPAASAFVTAIYANYKGKNAKGIRLDTEANIRRYFEPSLATLMIKDQKNAARRHDAPNLDGDPFVDAQDWDIAAFDIAVTDTVNNAASVTVKFRNADTPTVVVLDLVKTGNDWRVGDITWQTTARKRPCAGSTATDAPQARRLERVKGIEPSS
jgi:Protein of unknown function (DUF3828)